MEISDTFTGAIADCLNYLDAEGLLPWREIRSAERERAEVSAAAREPTPGPAAAGRRRGAL